MTGIGERVRRDGVADDVVAMVDLAALRAEIAARAPDVAAACRRLVARLGTRAGIPVAPPTCTAAGPAVPGD